MLMKLCPACEVVLPTDHFGRRSSGRLRGWCRKCDSQRRAKLPRSREEKEDGVGSMATGCEHSRNVKADMRFMRLMRRAIKSGAENPEIGVNVNPCTKHPKHVNSSPAGSGMTSAAAMCVEIGG